MFVKIFANTTACYYFATKQNICYIFLINLSLQNVYKQAFNDLGFSAALFNWDDRM